MVAFGAHALQAAFSGAFFLAFVQKVYLEGVALDREHVGELLSCSLYLGRHTPVVIMRRAVPRDSDVHRLIIEELKWSHVALRPWGDEIPIQCPLCGALGSLKCKQAGSGVTESFCSVPGCRYKVVHTKPDHWKTIRSGEGGQWSIVQRVL